MTHCLTHLLRLGLMLAVQLACFSRAQAQHPIEVERLSAQGEYLRAMVAFDQLPERRMTTAATIAAGKSAWALGLSDWAAGAFDKALRDPALSSDARARILFSRALLELQNGKPQVAALFSERSSALLKTASPLRAQVFAVWGRALAQTNEPGRACDLLTQAVTEAESAQRAPLYYDLGTCLRKLGELEQAKAVLERIPLDDERAPAAIRSLALISLDLKNYDHAEFWLAKGRELFPNEFLDSWVDYARMVVATEQAMSAGAAIEPVEALLKESSERYPPSDPWFQLLRAAGEQCLWKRTRAVSAETSSGDAQ